MVLRSPVRVVVVALGLLLPLSVSMSSADAAAKPPPASQLRLYQRTDHRLAVRFAVPAAFYHPGAGSVVRLTGGRTPAASPSKGYAVSTGGYHTAGTGPTLLANHDYTFAVWIRDHSVYSKRIALTVRTLRDTTKPEAVTNLTARAGIGNGAGRVVLSWKEYGDDLGYVRIVRNTKPTTTGGTVVNVRPGTQAYTDDKLPDAVRTTGGFTDAPLYYFVIPRDTAGNFATSYTKTSVVVGSRVISGTVREEPGRYVSLWGEKNPSSNKSDFVSGQTGYGAFSFRAPPGIYTVCDEPGTVNQDSASCWVVRPDGSTSMRAWPDGNSDTVADPSIDVRAGDYTKIAFTGTPSS